MGACGHMVFDDDTAYDALADLKEAEDLLAEMERYLDEAVQADYVGYDEGQYALVSAAVLDSVINDTPYRCDEDDYDEWINTLKTLDLTPIRQKAVEAVEAVLSDRSELNELWAENEELYSAWREDKAALQDRLR